MKKSLMWLIWAIVYFVVTVVTVAAIFQGLVTFPVIVLIIISMMLSMWIIKAIPDEQKEKKQNQRQFSNLSIHIRKSVGLNNYLLKHTKECIECFHMEKPLAHRIVFHKTNRLVNYYTASASADHREKE